MYILALEGIMVLLLVFNMFRHILIMTYSIMTVTIHSFKFMFLVFCLIMDFDCALVVLLLI